MREDDPQRQTKRPLSAGRLAATIAGALLLIGLVVVASRGSRPAGAVDTGGQTTSTVFINISLLVLAIVAAGMVAMVLFSFQPGRTAMPQPRTGPKLLGQLLGLLLLCGIAFVVLASIRSGWTRNQGLQRKTTTRGNGVDWLPAGIVFGATLVGIAALGVVFLRRQVVPEPEAALKERLARLLDETLNDLYAEEDPRRAVIAAYGRMERILSNYGMERRSAEAPHEYVSRVLEQVVASGSSVRRLTRLYERARFSPHSIDPAMKQEAIAALEAIRDELRAREAEALVVAPQ